ncbi:MAG: leucine-rich repeat domain-containing protein [Oscillospiraceae bacterium]|nr:leucine-rich repeat domain-containing protein [Oscillospiraceae bacterium]
MRGKRFVKKVVFWVLFIILIIGNLPVVDTQAEVYDEIQINSDSTDGEIFGQHSAVEDEEQKEPEGEVDDGSSSGTGVVGQDLGENTIEFTSSNGILTQENVIEQIGPKGYAEDDTFAAIIDDSVTRIGDGAFESRAGLKSVSFSNSLESIGVYSFYACTSLTKIEIPQSVVFVDKGAFLECSHLSEVYFDGNAPTVELFAFSRISSEAKAYVYPEYVYPSVDGFPVEWQVWKELKILYREALNVKTITFSTDDVNGTLSQTEVSEQLKIIVGDDNCKLKAEFHASVKAIGCMAFYECSQLVSIEIPITIVSIESRAFGDCKNLVKAYFDAGEPNVESDAFEGKADNAVAYVYRYVKGFPAQGELWNGFIVKYRDNSGERSITFNTFNANGTLTPEDVSLQLSLTALDYSNGFIAKFSDNVKAINAQAFERCTSLVSVIISDNVKSIGAYAFHSCTNLASIQIPDSVEGIGDTTFVGCTSLMEINVSDDNKEYSSSYDGVLFNWDKSTLICFPGGKSGSYTIPYGVVNIGGHSFDGCADLISVFIPNSVINIGSYAFSNCVKLSNVYFDGEAPTNVGRSAFSGLPKIALAHVYPPPVANKFPDEGKPWNMLTIKHRDIQNRDVSNNIIITFQTNSADGTLTYLEVGEQITGDRFIAEFDTSVKSIGNSAFDRCSNLMSVLIANNVSSIGDQAFNNCINLTDVMITDSVVSIGDWVFDGCASLKEINVSEDNVAYSSSVEGVLFNKDKTRLVVFPAGKSGSYVIPYGVTIIDDSAFYNCVGLTSVIIPNSVTAIADYAFNYCSSLTSITIPSNVKSIGNFAFAYCTNLSEIIGDLPEDDYIGAWAFDETPDKRDVPTSTITFSANGTLTQKEVRNQILGKIGQDDGLFVAEFEDTVTAIDDMAFYDYPNLTSVDLGQNVESIGELAFAYCVGLRDITIADNVTSVGIQAFYACSNLTRVDIGYQVNSIGAEAFAHCVGLEDIKIVDRVDNIGVGAFAFCKNLTYIKIPSGVTSISQELFYGCSSLTQVGIPDSVSSIGVRAFAFCDSLTEIYIPNGIIEISNGVFSGCSSIARIKIPASVVEIGDVAFGDCTSLESICIPDSVKNIGELAFYNCAKLESITIPNIPNGITEIKDYTFHSCESLKKIIIPDSVTSIGVASFAYCARLEDIKIPDKVTSIGEGAFRNCENIENIIIPNSVTTLGKGAFYECAGLESVKIGDGVKSISEALFEDCAKLIKVCGGNIITSIGKNAFYGCINLTSINFLQNVTSIGETAFYNCTSLTNIEFSKSLVSISHWAFGYCISLTNVDIPASVKYIGSRAFYRCTKLSRINFDDDAPEVGQESFLGVSPQAIAYVPSDAKGFLREGAFWNGLLVRYGKSVHFYPDKEGEILSQDGVITQLATAGIGDGYDGYPFEAELDETVKIIDENAFSNHSNLMNIVIPAGVEKIGSSAFLNCNGLLSIDIPESVGEIGDQAFVGCAKLMDINVSPDNIDYLSIDGVLFNNDKTTLIVYPNGKSGDYTIPEGVSSIGMEAFFNCTELTIIYIPNGVIEIPEMAFSNCEKLTTVFIPESMVSISSSSFNYCSNLSDIYFDGDAPSNMESGVFSNIQDGAKAHVYPSAEDFDAVEGIWQGLIVIYRDLPEEKTIIFYTCSQDRTLTKAEVDARIAKEKIPKYGRLKAKFDEKVDAIGDEAFCGLASLISIEIPENVKRIGSKAFENCKNLSEAYFYGNEPDVATGAFDGIYAGAVAYVNQYAKGFPALGQHWPAQEQYVNNGFIIRYQRDLIAYQYLPFSLMLPTTDVYGWKEIGVWPEGLKISEGDDIRERGEICGAPMEYGKYEVTVRAIDEEKNELPDKDMTFIIDIQERRTQVQLTELNEANAFKFEKPMGTYTNNYEEGIYVVNVDYMNPTNVDIEFASNNVDFIALWIDGEIVPQDSDNYSVQTIQGQSGGITSKIITVYWEKLKKLDATIPHVLAGEFKAGGAVYGQQYVIAQNFIINAIAVSTPALTPTPTPNHISLPNGSPTVALEEFDKMDNTDEYVNHDDRANPDNNDDSEDNKNPDQRSDKLDNSNNVDNINIRIRPTQLTDSPDGSVISPTPTSSPPPTPTPAPTPTTYPLSPTPTPQIGGFSTKGTGGNEPDSLEIVSYNSPTENNNINIIIIFGSTATCCIVFTCAVALKRRKNKKNA